MLRRPLYRPESGEEGLPARRREDEAGRVRRAHAVPVAVELEHAKLEDALPPELGFRVVQTPSVLCGGSLRRPPTLCFLAIFGMYCSGRGRGEPTPGVADTIKKKMN